MPIFFSHINNKKRLIKNKKNRKKYINIKKLKNINIKKHKTNEKPTGINLLLINFQPLSLTLIK